MLRNLLKKQLHTNVTATAQERGNLSLQIALWTLWTLCIIVVGYISWHADLIAQRPTNVIGLIVHCVVVGIVGLVILTKIEMWLEPWRFMQ